MTMYMGANSVYASVKGVAFQDGTVQTTAAVTSTQPNTLQCGVAVFTGGTLSTVTFAAPYIANSAPVVVCNALDGAVSGEPSSLTVLGSGGDWTGFVLTISHNLFGAYNWIALGNPN